MVHYDKAEKYKLEKRKEYYNERKICEEFAKDTGESLT